MLSTAHRVLDGDDNIDPIIYQKTHWNHPCSKWIRETTGNYNYGYNMFLELEKEYEFRFKKPHLSWIKLGSVLKIPPKNINPNPNMTEFVKAMPEQYKSINNAIDAYRSYYINEKSHLFEWTKRPTPYWIVK
jgi:hypothetical protein